MLAALAPVRGNVSAASSLPLTPPPPSTPDTLETLYWVPAFVAQETSAAGSVCWSNTKPGGGDLRLWLSDLASFGAFGEET